MVTLAQRSREYFVNPLGWEDVMTERADFRKFYRDAHAVGNLSEREKMFMGLAVALARNCQH
jgi:hypothetical protein